METFFDYNVSPTSAFGIFTFPKCKLFFNYLTINLLNWKLEKR